MTVEPLVSVVIATRRGGTWLEQAVDSVLSQSVRHLEVVVVNDGVDGDLSQLEATDPRVRVVVNQRKGLAFARNIGNRIARGRYVAVLDDDDRWLPGKLDLQLSVLEDRPEVAMCHTQFEIIDETGRVTGPGWSSPTTVDRLLNGTAPPLHSSTVWRREILSALGGYDPDAVPGIDIDLLLRLVCYYETAFLDTVLVQYRIHSAQMSGAGRYREVNDSIQRIWARQLPVLVSSLAVKEPVLAPRVWQRVSVRSACDAAFRAVIAGEASRGLAHLRWAMKTDPIYASRYSLGRCASFMRRRARRSGDRVSGTEAA